MEYSDKESKYFRAQEKVNELKKFYTSLISYVFVIAMLAGINYYTDQWNYPWFLWAAFGWGIGLIFNAIKVFGANPFLGKGWEERKINEIMNEDKDQNRWK
ncbi:2TM domain-containing protein [Aurantibacter crassamenti]|uniref:2TM domain-containing protein n=1 Tax=Aurantibacter crassamenti TaxID=1837375 RepID=UPI0019397C10|nr:2TM domain-containing protein [Aurantibacter crassamenti]MBM1107657.1 2TM domain-containing protein [Aurantibacter crassamenti]